jgi:hypothetical protein
MAAALDGVVMETGAVYEAKFMLPWSFSEGAAAEKHVVQLRHNMWVTNAKMAALLIITGGGKRVAVSITAAPFYRHLLLTAEKTFWRCAQYGEPPRLFGVEPPKAWIEGVRMVDRNPRTGPPVFTGLEASHDRMCRLVEMPVACLLGDWSQQPTCPQMRLSRRCTHHPPDLRHSSQHGVNICTRAGRAGILHLACLAWHTHECRQRAPGE